MFSQWRSVRRVSEFYENPPDILVVEKAKNALPVKPDQKYNLDFLTEATKLLSTAWHKGEDMSAAKLKLNRQEKVRGSLPQPRSTLIITHLSSGRRTRLVGSTETGTARRELFSKMPSNNMVLNYASSARRSVLDPSMRSSNTMAIGRSVSPGCLTIRG
jgi:hypothetical protein